MNQLMIGNAFSLLATVVDMYSASRKNARSMLLTQTVGQMLLAVSSFALGGYSAVVQNVVSIIRNLAALRKHTAKWLEYLLVVLGVVLGIVFNNLKLVGWLPILANLEYSVAVFRFKQQEKLLKIAFAVCVLLYTVFNLCISNYVGAAANLVVLVTAIIALVRAFCQRSDQ